MKRVFLAIFLAATSAHALTIDLDYGFDEGYFATNPGARMALEKAALDLGAAIRPSLGAVPTNVYTGEAGDPGALSTVTFTWSLNFENPSLAGVDEEVSAFSFAADVFRVYVGARELGGTTLGEGAMVGLGVSLETSFSDEADLVAALGAAETLSNTGMRRGGGPVSLEFSDGITAGATMADYTLQAGAIAGTMTFDLGTDWHFDVNTLPPAGKSDFYSVALHELMHAIGFGGSETWTELVSGADWLGPNAGQLTGGGEGLIDTGIGLSAHILAGTTSANIYTAATQEVAMDPNITTGTRKELTQLDLAMLRDLGYDAVPEPGAVALFGLAALGWVLARRRRG